MIDNKILDDFIGDFQLSRKDGISIVTGEDISQLKLAGFSVEELLGHLTNRYNSLLHGSRTDISGTQLLQNEKGKVYGSELAAIAIMRAIISNRGLKQPGLQYPYFIDETHQLEVKIHGINEDTIGDAGFIYVLNCRGGFENNPYGSWQYIRNGRGALINAKIAVQRNDFKYPIFDVTNNRRIQ